MLNDEVEEQSGKAENDVGEEKLKQHNEFEDKGVTRDKADVNIKLVSKFGKQEKDQGIQHLCWSLGNLNNDYISYLRGKSNVVEVFDTQTENVFQSRSYEDELGIIKGLAPLGDNPLTLKHILIDEKGKLIVSRISSAQ